MALATRVIPTLLARGHQLVKGQRFNSWRTVGHVTQSVRIHQSRGVDELLILDIRATPEGKSPDYEFIQRLTDECFMPVTYGGGVRSVDDVRRVLKSGADKVCIGTGCCEVPNLVKHAADEFGSQAIVVSIDVGYADTVMSRCGKVAYAHYPVEFAGWAEDQGAGEILLTSVDQEGTMKGYDLELIDAVSHYVRVPVVANGGCSGYEDMVKAVRAGASGVAVGALFAFTAATPLAASLYLQSQGIEARVE